MRSRVELPGDDRRYSTPLASKQASGRGEGAGGGPVGGWWRLLRLGWTVALVLTVAFAPPGLALAQGSAPDAADIRQAGESFDAGMEAYKAGRFEQAASHFEAADQTVPSAAALRGAMRARHRAGQAARASTLAAQAQRRYPADARLAAQAEEVLAAHAAGLHRLEVRCAAPCVLAVDTRAVTGPPSRKAVLFVEPADKVTVSASFAGADGDQQVIRAKAGGNNTLRFRPPGAAPSAPSTSDRSPERGPEQPASAPAVPPVAADAGDAAQPGTDSADESWEGITPVVFFIALGATLVVGGVTVWSGVDTLNYPGADEVRESCRGQGTDCPEYQEGLDQQSRTNVLIGVTAGTAALTAIFGLFLTDWSSEEAPEPNETAIRLAPALGGGGVQVVFD